MGKFRETSERFRKELNVDDALERQARQELANQIIMNQLFSMDNDDDYDDPDSFTKEEEDRIDEIYNACYEFCQVLTEKSDLEWSMYSIGEIVETACRMILIDPALGIDRIYFPAYIDNQCYGENTIQDYITSDDFEVGEF